MSRKESESENQRAVALMQDAHSLQHTSHESPKLTGDGDKGRELRRYLGISAIILTLALSWMIVNLPRYISNKSPVSLPLPYENDQIGTSSIRNSEHPIKLDAEQTYNNVTVKINSITPKRRFVSLDISVTNHGNTPVSFLGLVDAQLLSDEGQVSRVDFQSVGSFLTVNPNSTIRDTIKFLTPIGTDVKNLSLVINNVGHLQEKWYYEIPFSLP